MKLSVIIPVYNESKTIYEILRRVKEVDIEKEIIIVDDGSTDETRELLIKIQNASLLQNYRKDEVKIIYHEKNMGKGAAIRTGLKEVTGDLVIIQDADLEYYPQDYHLLMRPIVEGRADVVYGSRFIKRRHITLFPYYLANKFLTLLVNILYKAHLTDMETCYKMFKTGVIKKIELKSNRFNFEPEVTAKILKRRYKICEVPISYKSRGYSEGKKIKWIDGFEALWTVIKYRFFD